MTMDHQEANSHRLWSTSFWWLH